MPASKQTDVFQRARAVHAQIRGEESWDTYFFTWSGFSWSDSRPQWAVIAEILLMAESISCETINVKKGYNGSYGEWEVIVATGEVAQIGGDDVSEAESS